MPAGRARRTLGLLAMIGLAASCTDKGRSLVLVDVSVDPAVTTVASVRAVVVQASSAIGENDAGWNSSPVELGVYLAKSVSGAVQVVACGFDATGAGVAAASGMSVTVQPGATAGPVAVTLTAGAPAALCGSGTSGNGGAGGGVVGSGGSSGGIGGAGGRPGTGGSATGSGGARGGSGGAGGMGTGGGQGGTSGIGGAAGSGTGGSGTGGSGTGGSGTGGTGTGGTGTGGSGGPSWANAVGIGGQPLGDVMIASVAVDSSGNAVVAFQNGNAIYTNHYDASQNTWGTAAPLDTRGIASGVQVAVDKNGIYVAVWGIPNDPTMVLTGIWESSSSDGINWSSPPTRLTNTSAFSPSLSMNANGDAVAAWTESVPENEWEVAAAIRTGGDNPSWGAPTVLLPSNDDGNRNQAAVMSGTGEAFVGWEQGDGTVADTDSVWMAQYSGGAWGPASVFDDDVAAASTISLAANKNGSAIATYVELTSASTDKLWSRRYTPGNGFAAALPVADDGDIDTTVPPALVLDDSGVATVAWDVQVGSDFEVHASRAAANATSWPAETAIETDDTAAEDDPNSYNLSQVTMPQLGCDPAGNVTLIWRKRTNASGLRFDLVSRRLPAGGTWNPQVPVESMDTLSVYWPALGVGADGTAVAAWYYSSDGASTASLWANVFH